MSPDIKDFYAVLGVERDASPDDIKKAFRAKARECHPDVCDTDDGEERFKAVNEAYEVLSDARKREVYDRFGTADPRAAGMGATDVPFEDIFGMGMEDVFSMFFGGAPRGGRRRASREGRDMAMHLTISLEEAATGTEKEIELGREATCEECDGTGGEDASPVTCPDCKGSGQRAATRQTVFGAMRTVAPCERCAQTGEIVENACGVCNGLGRVATRERVTVPVMAGAGDGTQIRVEGRGEAGLRGAASGDLIAQVRVAPHERLFREGDDLHVQARIPMTTAALGGTITFPGLMYDEQAEIPAGTQHGSVVRVKGRGMPRLRGSSTGDLYVHVAVDVPKKLSRDERTKLEEFGASRGDGDATAKVDRVSDWLGHR